MRRLWRRQATVGIICCSSCQFERMDGDFFLALSLSPAARDSAQLHVEESIATKKQLENGSISKSSSFVLDAFDD